MNDKRCFEALDRTLQDISNNENAVFGGKSIILGGDFQQTLPVVKNASRSQILAASIVNSYLWPSFKVFRLIENMRLARPNITDEERVSIQNFSSWILDIGNGNIGVPDDCDPQNCSWVEIPKQYCINDDENCLSELISYIYNAETLQQPTATKLQEQVNYIINGYNRIDDLQE
ncbi:uncharacterized protein [Rutidosis leptorrhynchoides]|uniref:uncharacterized protein n=1 Tax=Rutidosis leptorrhynchoides TaxID=125765 RepID=UPI003A993F38